MYQVFVDEISLNLR